PEAEDGTVEFQNDVNKSVWGEVVPLRESGELLEMIEGVECPVVAIHGDYDPHPVSAVEEPLRQILEDFRMIVIPKCGHEPWKERQARDNFERILLREVGD
ncbi:MAG TPA: alpha/beta hydrolase, partial [Fimbriimonadaceae bacterium]|nr:alpha/beta hydrolase [Fimbriimonadaceae bacterium]